jgi:pimeloyl-ACP methyl ester carboxylesterase
LMRFVLVHGGFHGAWCWERLIPELGKRGHEAVAIDLPGHGKRVDEEASLAGYRDAVAEVIEGGDVLVGHSMGGFVVSVAADVAAERLSHVMYLDAGLPIEGQPMTAAGAGDLSGQISSIEVIDDGRRMRFCSNEAATAFFYHDCSPDIAQWACSKLTPQQLAPMMEAISIPRFWAADLPRSLILCRHSRSSSAGEAGTKQTIARLGVEPFWMDSSHSPFLGQPGACADLMIEAIGRAPIGPLRPS